MLRDLPERLVREKVCQRGGWRGGGEGGGEWLANLRSSRWGKQKKWQGDPLPRKGVGQGGATRKEWIKGRGLSTEKNVVGFGGPGKAVSLLRQQE